MESNSMNSVYIIINHVLKPLKFSLALLFLISIRNCTVHAQSIPMELFVGNENMQSSITISRPFMPNSKFRILSISSFEVHKNDERKNSSVINTDVSYSVSKIISAGIGFTNNSVTGFSPTAGCTFTKITKRGRFIVSPAITFGTNTAIRLIINRSHKFRLSDKVKLYISTINLLTYGLDGVHVRSYSKKRLGLDYNTLQFGLGVNLDWYGENRNSNTNWGVFLRKEF